MQYFTFIGMGDKVNGYKEVYYSFKDNPNEAVMSRFVQELIINRHQEELDEVYVFATEQSRKRYEEELNNNFKDKVHLNFIDIQWGISYEDYVSQLLKYMKEDEDVILDITHSFRHIPMKLLFALKYIELTKKVRIQHLYYGLLQPDDIGIVVDFVNDYRMQQISDLLAQFDRTLMINANDIDSMVLEKDDKMTRFLESLSSFNKMIEYCEFDNSLKEIRKITESCNSIIKEEEKYSLIIPLVIKIKEKFAIYSNCSNDIDKKEELIRILIEHNRMQVAITFIDQFFREELIRNTLEPQNKKFNLQTYLANHKDLGIKYRSNTFYQVSQYLRIDVYKMANGKALNNYSNLVNKKDDFIEEVKSTLTKNHRKNIDVFFSEIRNHMNHGTSIKMDIAPVLYDVLDCIKAIGKRG